MFPARVARARAVSARGPRGAVVSWAGGLLRGAAVGLIVLGVAPSLHASPRGQKIEGRARLEGRGGPLTRVARGRAVTPLLPVLVQTTDPAGIAARLRAAGGHVGTVAGDVLTARIPRSLVADLAEDPAIVRVEVARRVRPRLDQVRAVLGVDAIQAGEPPLSGAYTGRDVLVGAVDLSVDIGHPAFFAQGSSRIVELWDQDGRGPPPAGFDYGGVCTAADIDAGRCPHSVYYDHGTGVLAIAGGSRLATTAYQGMAPSASLAFVSLGGLQIDDDFDAWFTSALCDGVAYLFALADSRGEPAVVNLSVGTHAGPHDGSSLGDRCLDNLVGPGRIVVAAAGNEGGPSLHGDADELVWVHASGAPGAAAERLSMVWGDQLLYGEQMQVWFEDGHDTATLRVGVRTADGREVVSEPVALTDPVTELALNVGGVALGPAWVVTDQAPSGDRAFEVVVMDEDADGAESVLTWFVELADTGPFDAYLDINSGGGFVDRDHAAGITLDAQMSVGFPATAAGVLAVGSSVSRIGWRALDGAKRETYDPVTGADIELGALSTFSSRGPTRDPERTGPKPDCVAPGEMVITALPAGLVSDTDAELIIRDRPAYFAITAGTSEAAPAAAGVIALLLERDPTLDPAALRAIFRATSVLPQGEVEDGPAWGTGLLDARAALLATDEVVPGDPVAPARETTEGGCRCAAVGGRGAGGPGVAGVAWLGLVACAAARRRRREASGRGAG